MTVVPSKIMSFIENIQSEKKMQSNVAKPNLT